MSDETVMKMPLAVRSAYEVVELWEAYRDALAQIERLRDYEHKYHELLNEDLKHGEKMMDSWLSLLLSDRVKIVEPQP